MEECKIYDRRSGELIVRATSTERAEKLFSARNGSWENAFAVNGSEDVQIHDLACFWEKQYRWLSEFLKKHDAAEKLEISLERLALWLKIRHSREVALGYETSSILDVFGEQLASELDFLQRLDQRPGCRTFGPDTGKIWKAAYAAANSFSQKYRVPYVVGWHHELGVITVSPEVIFLRAPVGFEQRKLMTITRTL